jgi:cold shock CspA family protein
VAGLLETMMQGTLVVWDKCYGFIRPRGRTSTGDVFVGKYALDCAGLDPRIGLELTFEIEHDRLNRPRKRAADGASFKHRD